MLDAYPVRREVRPKKRSRQAGASDDDRTLVGDGRVERDTRAVGAGWLRTFSKGE
jgi:hypothetical protein